VFAFQSSITFDTALAILITPLMTGGSIAVAAQGEERNLARLGSFLKSQKATAIYIVPSSLNLLCTDESFKQCRWMRFAMTTGEKLSRVVAEKFQQVHPNGKLWNMYGPTETTVTLSSFCCTVETAVFDFVPVGKSNVGANVHILESSNYARTESLGTKGSLFLSGMKVSLGYQNLEKKTRECFVYDPFFNDGSQRMFNSGDQGRIMESGDIEFLGRNDDQIKISGQRVELGAIENAIWSCKGVESCIVLVQEVAGAGKKLVGYVGCGDMKKEKYRDFKKEIQKWIRQKLARHEMPHQLVLRSHLPLTVTGKADRKRLQSMQLEPTRTPSKPDVVDTIQKSEPLAGQEVPELSVKDHILEAFKKVLGENVDLRQTFWEQGGTSLMGMQLTAEIQKTTNVSLSMPQLLRNGTVGGIKELIRDGQGHTDSDQPCVLFGKKREGPETPMITVEQDRPMFVRTTEGQAGLYLIWKMDPLSEAYSQGVVIEYLDQTCRAREEHVFQAVLSLHKSHSALRTKKFHMCGSVLLQEVGGSSADPIYDQFEVGTAQEVVCVTTMNWGSWNLENGDGVARVSEIRFSEEDRVILQVAMHHIIMDEWSSRVIQEELKEEYQRAKGNASLQAIEMSVVGQFWEFAEFEASFLERNGGRLREWWRKHLEGTKALQLGSVRAGSSSICHPLCCVAGNICFIRVEESEGWRRDDKEGCSHCRAVREER